jgi:hypothetical protein
MRNKHQILGIIIGIIIFLILAIGLPFLLSLNRNTTLHSLEEKVDNIHFPSNIEKITIKSAIGDSGGNGNFSTYRVVLVVKTKLNKDELHNTIENMNLHFPNHYKRSPKLEAFTGMDSGTPIFYVTKCESSKLQSPREFELDFDELKEINNYSDYYFIEFVE